MPNISAFLKTLFPDRRVQPVRRPDISGETLRPVGLQEFLSLQLPPREMLLGPILPERGLAMLYAPRGVGKSWLGLSIGLAVASGADLLRWQAPNSRRVLYVDGEMPLSDLQLRLAAITAGMGIVVPNDGFKILAADSTESGINIGSEEGQRAIEGLSTDVDLLILDNLSTLASGSEGASDAWLPMQNFLLRLRRKGVSVLIIHHAGVNGRQRGTSRREDALDTVVALRRPADYSPKDGARFEIHIEKARTLTGDAATPFEALVQSLVMENGKPGIRWIARDLKPGILARAADLFAEGLTVRQVAAALGVSRSEAGRVRQRAEAEGLLDDGADEEGEPEVAMSGDLRPN
jgi:hypothetical protein